MAIKVTNSGKLTAEFAINRWGDGGSTGYFDIKPGEEGSWDRTDIRGFVMSVRYKGSVRPYYVQAESTIVFKDDWEVEIDGYPAKPISCC